MKLTRYFTEERIRFLEENHGIISYSRKGGEITINMRHYIIKSQSNRRIVIPSAEKYYGNLDLYNFLNTSNLNIYFNFDKTPEVIDTYIFY